MRRVRKKVEKLRGNDSDQIVDFLLIKNLKFTDSFLSYPLRKLNRDKKQDFAICPRLFRLLGVEEKQIEK